MTVWNTSVRRLDQIDCRGGHAYRRPMESLEARTADAACPVVGGDGNGGAGAEPRPLGPPLSRGGPQA
jgi:hypothetical protein